MSLVARRSSSRNERPDHQLSTGREVNRVSMSEVIWMENSPLSNQNLETTHDDTDAPALLGHIEIRFSQTGSARSAASLPDLTGWDWLGWNPSDDQVTDTYTNSRHVTSGERMPTCVVRHIRKFLIIICCLLYLLMIYLNVNCNETKDQRSTENAFLNTSASCSRKVWKQVLRGLKLNLISILGVISISLVTRLVFFLCALYTWRWQFRRSAASTMGPFRKPAKLVQMFIIICLVVFIHILCSLAFHDAVTFEWAEVFASAGLATIITVSLGLGSDTKLEKNFQHKNEKDGYVYGLAHAYFVDRLEPFLTSQGRRQTLLTEWSHHGPSETFLVLLVESRYFIEEVFRNEELANDLQIVDTKDSVHLLKITLGSKDDSFFCVHVPVLVDEHLLLTHDWFRSDGHTRVPLEEQKAEYESTLNKLLRDRLHAVGGTLGRMLFWRIPNVSVHRIPHILRLALYDEFGAPNSQTFLENMTQVLSQDTVSATGSTESVRRRISHSDRSSSDRDSGMSKSSELSSLSFKTC